MIKKLNQRQIDQMIAKGWTPKMGGWLNPDRILFTEDEDILYNRVMSETTIYDESGFTAGAS